MAAAGEIGIGEEGPPGWHNPVIPDGAIVLSESPIAYIVDNFLSGLSPGLLTQGVPGVPQDPWRRVEDPLDPLQLGKVP
jgi:hypothetical protein